MSDKKKKKKVVYYDDGRTIADMSNLYGKPADNSGKKQPDGGEPSYKGNPYFGSYRPGHTPKDWHGKRQSDLTQKAERKVSFAHTFHDLRRACYGGWL